LAASSSMERLQQLRRARNVRTLVSWVASVSLPTAPHSSRAIASESHGDPSCGPLNRAPRWIRRHVAEYVYSSSSRYSPCRVRLVAMPWPWRASPSPSPRRARSGGQLSAVSRHKPKKEAQSQEAQGRRKGHSEKGGRKGLRGREARASMALKTMPTRRNLWSAQGRPSLQR